MSPPDVSVLRKVLSGIVGDKNVLDDTGTLAGYSIDGGGTPRPGLVARPGNPRQVRDVVRLAKETGTKLVFASSGPPRFRGDTSPREDDAVIVDMSAMDTIRRMDRRNKVALIEPGVRFGPLQEAADREGLKVLMPLLPRSSKSALASMLEREPITIPRYHWDMTDPLLCTELVFGTGDLFRTGSAAGPGSLEEQWDRGLAQKNPMGPAQTDFMRIVQGSQGTMAAVTWATVKLELKPSMRRLYMVPSSEMGPLIDFSYRVLKPKLADEFFILSAFAFASMLGSGPDEIAGIAGGLAPYTCVYAVSGFEYLPEQRVAFQDNDIRGHARACGLEPVTEVPGATSSRVEEVIGAVSPEPYYKLRPKGRFFEVLFLTTLDRVPSFVEVMESVAREHGYAPGELGTYVQPVQHGRTCHLEFNIFYEPAGEERARAFFSDASRAVSEAGAFFSRPYGEWSDLAYARCPDTVEALRRIKAMLDPDNVLNPGNLCFKGVE